MIYVAADQNGSQLADEIIAYCNSRSIEIGRMGSQTANDRAALEEFIPPLVNAVRNDPSNTGVLICGTGQGVEVGANRFSGIRASLCANAQFATWARQYDNANVLCLSGWATAVGDVPEIMNAWLASEFDGDEGRIKMLSVFDSWGRS